MRLHVRQQLLVERLRRPPQCQLAKRGAIPLREVMLERPLRLLPHIDLPLLKALNQIVRRDVDDFNVVGAFDDRVGHGLADPTEVICATISFRLSMCWIFTVV